ncbi:hypothetical protein G9A89_005805 [Geosiphon pyriformis]|nr:hypothetical protein G9A89_005805 [Geosiphon pyriformis]
MQQPTASISPSTSTIPQFVVIHDQFQQSWKHPIVHYVFEGEDFPTKVPKSSCVVVNFAEDGENIKEAHSLSHTFQITNCKISSTPQIGAQAGKESGAVTASLMLTIEGVSAGKYVLLFGTRLTIPTFLDLDLNVGIT